PLAPGPLRAPPSRNPLKSRDVPRPLACRLVNPTHQTGPSNRPAEPARRTERRAPINTDTTGDRRDREPPQAPKRRPGRPAPAAAGAAHRARRTGRSHRPGDPRAGRESRRTGPAIVETAGRPRPRSEHLDDSPPLSGSCRTTCRTTGAPPPPPRALASSWQLAQRLTDRTNPGAGARKVGTA